MHSGLWKCWHFARLVWRVHHSPGLSIDQWNISMHEHVANTTRVQILKRDCIYKIKLAKAIDVRKQYFVRSRSHADETGTIFREDAFNVATILSTSVTILAYLTPARMNKLVICTFVGHRPKAYRHPVTIDVGLFSTGYLIGIAWPSNHIWMCEGDGWWQ